MNDDMFANEDQERDERPDLAAVMPRGFALVVSDDDEARRRIAWQILHQMVAHVGTGTAGCGLPNIPGRRGLMIYEDEDERKIGGVRLQEIIDADPDSEGSLSLWNEMQPPMRYGRIDPQIERRLVRLFGEVGIVGMSRPDLITDLPLRDASDRALACGYLSRLAAMAETTIVTSVVGEEVDEHLNGRIWVVPELVHTRWSVHVLPGDEEGWHQIRILGNERIHVQINIEQTERGFQIPT